MSATQARSASEESAAGVVDSGLGTRESASQAQFADLIAQLTDALTLRDASAIESLLGANPTHANRLQKLLPTLEVLAALNKSTATSGSRPPTPDSRFPLLSDFRLVREIGRGGMGIVYEAEQLSLRRRVALKILPLAGLLDDRLLQRFKNEAQAAAGLTHPNIVPIHAVGCENHIHYYAMQLVDGLSLDKVIDELANTNPTHQRGSSDTSPKRKQGADGTGDNGGNGEAIRTEGSNESKEDGPNWEQATGHIQTEGNEDRQKPEANNKISWLPLRPSVQSALPASPSGSAPLPLFPPIQSASASPSFPSFPSVQFPPVSSSAYFRFIAELGIQAADALHYAHERGIIHRDIKPGNLLLDTSGKLWITDFGLAAIEGSPQLTMTGDLVGTLRYMSPEQATAKHALLDQRTDIYSLGATLYELLTRRPAIAPTDRAQILYQIAHTDPIPPRKLNSRILAELETITLNCLAKNPAERYATALELRDDLRNFIHKRPILAKPASLSKRAGKWVGRHKPVVLSAGALLLLLTIATAGFALLLWAAQQRTKAALVEARANLAEAQRQQRRAESNYRRLSGSLDDIFGGFNPDRLPFPTVDKLRAWQAERVLHYLNGMHKANSSDPFDRLESGVAYVHTARVYQTLEDREGADAELANAVKLFTGLTREFPLDQTYQFELADALHIRADNLYLAGHHQKANASWNRCLDIWREMIREDPADTKIYNKLGLTLCDWFDPALRNPVEALELASKAVAQAPQDRTSWYVLGIAAYRMGDWNTALAALERAMPSTDGGLRPTRVLLLLAMAQFRCGRSNEAIETYHKATNEVGGSPGPRDRHYQMERDEAAALLGQ